MSEPGMTYDRATGRYVLSLSGQELITLRYALARGRDDLGSEALFLKHLKSADQGHRDSAADTAQRARALSDKIEAYVKGLDYGL